MSRRPKIIWSLTEESDWYAAFIVELQDRKVPKPATPAYLKQVMEAARVAAKVIKVERRRDFTSIDAIRGSLGQRLVEQGFFPRNYLDVLRMRPRVREDQPDPRDERIVDLTNQLEAAQTQLKDMQQLADDMRERIATLENQPGPTKFIQDFISEILANALDMHERRQKPAHMVVSNIRKEDLPAFERERRRDPVATAAHINGGSNSKPKFALVADFVGSDKATIHERLSDTVELRYLDAGPKLQGLKVFNANGGRIVLWAEHCPHDWQQSLKSMGVSFSVYRGGLPGLVDFVKAKLK